MRGINWYKAMAGYPKKRSFKLKEDRSPQGPRGLGSTPGWLAGGQKRRCPVRAVKHLKVPSKPRSVCLTRGTVNRG